jgi:hypothetical protein
MMTKPTVDDAIGIIRDWLTENRHLDAQLVCFISRETTVRNGIEFTRLYWRANIELANPDNATRGFIQASTNGVLFDDTITRLAQIVAEQTPK